MDIGNQVKKVEIQQKILQNLKKDINKCFEKYRTVTNQESNRSFRKKLYLILKKEILLSLSPGEKEDLLLRIHKNVYKANGIFENHDEVNSPGNIQPITSTHKPVLYNQPNFSGYFNVNELYQENVFTTDMTYVSQSDNGYELLPRNVNCEEKYISKSCVSSDTPELDDLEDTTECENYIDDQSEVDQIYEKLSEMISNNEDIIKEFEHIKLTQGEETYRKAISYVPVIKPNSPYKKEPLLFQLARKLDYYESTLDKLLDDKLFSLDQKNYYRISIFNVLLFTSFDDFCKFLSYIQRKNIKANIQYIISGLESSERFKYLQSDYENCSDVDDTESTNDYFEGKLKIPLAKYNQSEEFLITKGLLYCREIIKQSKDNTFIKELKSLDLLNTVLDMEINKSSYISLLEKNYPNSLPEITHIIRVDDAAILRSSFFAALAKRNIKYFHDFLMDLIKLEIDKRKLCKLCQEKTETGDCVSSIIEHNRIVDYQKQVKQIQEFIRTYKIEQ